MEGHLMSVDDVAYCGLYCAECPNHTGKIADLARDLRKELRSVRYDKTAEFLSTISWFKPMEKYPEAYEVLGAMVKLRCRKNCRSGGGNPSCKIKRCVQNRSFNGCWECNELRDCKKLAYLEPVHGKAHIKNLASIKKNGTVKFVKGKKLWYLE